MFGKSNTLLALLLIFCSFAGQSESEPSKKKVKRYLKDAQAHFFIEDYFKALQHYKMVLSLDKNEEVAGVNAAICVFKLGYPLDSMGLITSNLASSGLPDAKYYLAKIRHQQHAFDDAIQLLNQYSSAAPKNRTVDLKEVNYLITVCQNAKIHYNNPHRSIIKNMGATINSSFPDYVPVIVPDENTVFFTSKREGSTNPSPDAYGSFDEDVYVSYKQNGAWQKAKNIGPPINSKTNDACVAISPDGQRMIVFRTAVDQVTGDLYITRLGPDNTWGELEKMGNEINSQYIETSACFSNDTSEIYFSSNRPGGYGGKDIYRIKKAPNGRWAMPYNLGPSVNTPYDDDAPYLHPDGVTLFFSSMGHSTMGDFDVFKSVLNPEDNQFYQAENLGYPINDVGSDIFFVLSVDGQRAYYSSIKKETYGGIDIYEIDTRFGDNDLRVRHGTALVGDKPGRVKITLTDVENNQVNGNYYSNPSTGSFILVINPLKAYKALVEGEGREPLLVDLAPLAMEKTTADLEFKLDKK